MPSKSSTALGHLVKSEGRQYPVPVTLDVSKLWVLESWPWLLSFLIFEAALGQSRQALVEKDMLGSEGDAQGPLTHEELLQASPQPLSCPFWCLRIPQV